MLRADDQTGRLGRDQRTEYAIHSLPVDLWHSRRLARRIDRHLRRYASTGHESKTADPLGFDGGASRRSGVQTVRLRRYQTASDETDRCCQLWTASRRHAISGANPFSASPLKVNLRMPYTPPGNGYLVVMT